MRTNNPIKEQAIKDITLQIIAAEGLENLSMQKLAKAANISPRTIYLKYKDKDDLLVKLYVDEVIGTYQKVLLEGLTDTMPFDEGIKRLWQNTFNHLKDNRPAFALMQYGKSSPLLNKAFQDRGIKQEDHFKVFLSFLQYHIDKKTIINLHIDVYLALLFAPLHELVKEYFDYADRSQQIITPAIVTQCCEAVIKGVLIKN
ncbi:TetR/AcrR family transcriptional regulator [Mucilaginibacter litoreus]|uniref:TetR/AcrR family transcriptional regulator n=1 Tax=Mucilaginibacter litoreus TaxID=1048221 RepID=A0ABW3APR2_9SPHI